MRSIKYKILLPTLVNAVLIACLLVLAVALTSELKQESARIGEWGAVIRHLDAAISAGNKMKEIAERIPRAPGEQREGLHFRYMEQYLVMTQHIHATELFSKIPDDVRAAIVKSEASASYRDTLDPAKANAALQQLLPQLEAVHTSFHADIRSAIVQYCDLIALSTSDLALASFILLLAAPISAIALAWWIGTRIERRLRPALDASDSANCQALASIPLPPTSKRDEIDRLVHRLADMTQRLTRVAGSDKVLAAAEEERRRIAMDLHDQILSDLTGLRHDLQALSHAATPSAADLATLDQHVMEIVENIRGIMDDLHPQTLDMLGLEAALESHLNKKLKRPGLPSFQLVVDDDIDTPLNPFQRVSLYRITLEAIHNAIHHSRCNRYEIDCRRTSDHLVLSVEDNGTGFSYETAVCQQRGRGLANIEQRAKNIGAVVRWIRSRFSSGTRFELFLPLAKHDIAAHN